MNTSRDELTEAEHESLEDEESDRGLGLDYFWEQEHERMREANLK